MAREKKSAGGTGRREFLSGAGAAFTFGAVAGIAGKPGPAAIAAADTPVAGRIEHNPSVCAGCGVCSLMCSLNHEKETAFKLSRSEIVRDPFEATYSLNVCRQCLAPSCYQACPNKGSALCIDAATGIKYVNIENCIGCGECTNACPLEPAGVKLNPNQTAAMKCDLCRGRENGPICVEYCAQQALAVGTGNGRVRL
jgi:Fe-S-cluster-containing hydrogenase component 2